MHKWICTKSFLGIFTVVVTTAFISSCLTNTKKIDTAGVSNVHQYDPPPMFTSRQIAGERKTCDLGKDRCGSEPLSEAQMAKTTFLTDLVAEKIKAIEAEEKAAGRDFKVALIARAGSDLSAFQPLIDVDDNGNILSTEELGQEVLDESQDTFAGKIKEAVPLVSNVRAKMLRRRFDRSKTIKYSHLGIAVRNMDLRDNTGRIVTNKENGQWTVIQLLYSCDDGKRSYIYKGTLGNFFYDHMDGYAAHILVPSPELQNNLEQILVKDYLGSNWVEKHYNALALPYDLNQQNSNQWVLEVVAAALYEPGKILTREAAQNVLKGTQYRATKLTPNKFLYKGITLKGVGGLMSSMIPAVCMKSQPTIHKYGIGEVITELSVKEYLSRMGRLVGDYEVELSKEDQEELDKMFRPQCRPVPGGPKNFHQQKPNCN